MFMWAKDLDLNLILPLTIDMETLMQKDLVNLYSLWATAPVQWYFGQGFQVAVDLNVTAWPNLSASQDKQSNYIQSVLPS